MEGKWRAFRKVVLRKRVFEPDQLETGNLRRCLNRWDLTGLGLGSTLGVGVYVLVGSVALRIAGPSIVLSFLIAAVASLLAGLCYAEFGSRVPKAGSSYIYAYVTVGELVAFIIGWNVVLECLFGTASVAKGLSTYIDSMSNGAMSAWFESFAPLSTEYFFSSYFDFLAFFIVIILGGLLAFGVRESSTVNNVLAIINMIVILFIIVAGAVRADVSNWSIPESEVPTNTTTNYGTGGFFPYGPWGTLKGAAVCFYGFVGFETISATGEEVREPRRTIPMAILTVLVIVFFVYAGVATVVTMMVPYFLLDRVAAVATAFTYVEWEWARWIVSVGAVFGIFASLFGAMFPLPRLLYAMASDGLLMHWFAKVSDNNQSPRVATVLPACIIAILASTMELDQLILMMCVGTLLSYTIVAACVIVLRYRSDNKLECHSYLKQMFGCGGRSPSRATARIVDIILSAFICMCVVTGLVATHVASPLIPVVLLHVIVLVLLLIITVQPQAKEELPFKTPLVPIVPLLSIYVNIHLMVLINIQTWIRIGIWVLIGLPIYVLCLCCYKRKKSNLEENMKTFAHAYKNGKPPVQIVVESPTPPVTTRQTSLTGVQSILEIIENPTPMQEKLVRNHAPIQTDDLIVQQAVLQNNEEKEAKIIDLLDQVLQAEEDTYGEILSLKEDDVVTGASDGIPHRKSLSDLSDAGSDASLGIQVLSKYDVIAQVHREDLPKVSEEEEKHETDEAAFNIDVEIGEAEHINEETGESEQVTAFNDSDTNSRTDESGYSDTLDRNALHDSTEDTREDAPYIPTPPPFDENYFATSYYKKSYSIPPLPATRAGNDLNNSTEDQKKAPYIPPPPPFDESFFANPYFRKSYSIPRGPVKLKPVEVEEENKPRESVKSNDSHDGTMVFGSDRQMSFMSKLNKIYQTRITTEGEGEEQRRRSNSTGDMVENSTFALNRERPSLFYELKNELKSLPSTPILRPVNAEPKQEQSNEDEDEDNGMSRDDLRSKLTVIFGTGGPKPFKPRVMKSNPPTPEESYHTDSSTESITKLPKMEKNDTLKRQKDKFSAVLNSFRLSLNKDDAV